MPESGIFDSLFSPAFQNWVKDFRQDAKENSSSLTVEGYLRLVIIVGAYCMLRPYLVKLGGRFQASDHDRELEDDDNATAKMVSSPAAMSPNALRGRGLGVVEDEDDSSEEEKKDSAAPKWGRGARKRQKKRKAQETRDAEEKLKLDEEGDSDREIEEFLRKAID